MTSPPLDPVYPIGGQSKRNGGQGIFYDHEADEPLQVWVDLDLKGRSQMLRDLQAEGAMIAIDHWSESTHILILSAKSVHIFNMYCHPEWLRPNAKYMYYRAREKAAIRGDTMDEPWKKKVLLKEWWVQHCLDAGEFLDGRDAEREADHSPPTSVPRFVPPLPRPDPLLLTPESFKNLSPEKSVSPLGSPSDSAPLSLHDRSEASPPLPKPTEPAMDVEDEDESGHYTANAGNQDNALPVDTMIEETEGNDPPQSEAHDVVTIDVPTPENENEVGGQSFQTEMDEVDQAIALGADTDQDAADASILEENSRAEREDEEMDIDAPSSPPLSVPAPEHDSASAIQLFPAPINVAENPASTVHSDHSPSDIAVPVISQSDSAASEAVELVEDKESDRDRNIVIPQNFQKQDSSQILSTETNTVTGEHDDLPIVATPAETTPVPPRERIPQQTPALDPTLLFAGLRFWVDPKRPNRTQLLRSIQKSGGRIVADYSDATHVLVHGFATSPPADRDHWQQIMREIVPQGVWFLYAQWALKSLDSNRRLPESDFYLPGGAPDIANGEVKPVITTMQQESQAEGSQTAAKKRDRLPLDQILQTLEDNKALLETRTDHEAGVSLAQNRGFYSSKQWSKLVRQYRMREGRFAESTVEGKVEQTVAMTSNTTCPQTRNEAGPSSSKPPQEVGSAGSSGGTVRKLPTSLENLDPHTLRVLRIAYEIAITSRMRRKNFLESYRFQTSIKDPALWARRFDEFQRREGFSKHTETELVSLFKTYPARRSGAANKGLQKLLDKNTSFDRDGMKALYGEWTSGKWPAQGREQEPPPLQRNSGSTAAGQSPTTGTSSLAIQPTPQDSSINNGRAVRKTNEELARILLPIADDIDAYPLSRVASTLMAEHGIYTHGSWSNLISDWVNGTERFKGFGPKWDPSKSDAAIKLPENLPRRNASRSPVKTTTEAPDSAKSSRSASLRVSPAKVRPTALQTDQGTAVATAHLSTDDLDFIFKRYSPLVDNGMAIAEMCNLLVSAHGNYTVRTWGLYHSDWKRNTGRFEGFVPDPNYKALTKKRRRSSDSASNASVAGRTPTSRKRQSRGYSDEEEKNMAKYIVSRQPEDTRPNVKDWEDFAKKYPSRSAAGYAEHYRGYSSRIDRLAHEVSSLGTGERELSVETQDSDDSSVIELAPPFAKKPKQFVDMTEFDSD